MLNKRELAVKKLISLLEGVGFVKVDHIPSWGLSEKRGIKGLDYNQYCVLDDTVYIKDFTFSFDAEGKAC